MSPEGQCLSKMNWIYSDWLGKADEVKPEELLLGAAGEQIINGRQVGDHQSLLPSEKIRVCCDSREPNVPMLRGNRREHITADISSLSVPVSSLTEPRVEYFYLFFWFR